MQLRSLMCLCLLGGCLTIPVLGCKGARETAPDPAAQHEERGGALLHTETYRGSVLSPNPRLVVVLHGDAPFNDPDYHYAFARLIAEENDDVVAVGLLRPGYADPEGHQSPGERGQAIGDNYTPEVVHAVAETVRNLNDVHKPRRVVIVGHSGGAAVAANVLGLATGLIDGAVLVSCPCDVPRFREHMRELRDDATWKSLWEVPVQSISPLDLVPDIDPATQIILLVGANDDVTPPALTETYAERLRMTNVAVEVVVLEERGHEMFLDAGVRAAVSRLLNE